MKRKLGKVLIAATGFLFGTLGMGAFGMQIALAATGLEVSEQDVVFIPAPVAQVVDVVDVLHLQNPSNTPQDLVVTLPTGFENVAVDGVATSSSRIQQSVLTIPGFAKPGKTQVTITFKLPFQAQQGEQISLHTNYPIYDAKLYLPIGDMALSAEGLQTTTQTESVSGSDYRVFSRLGIPAGDDWGISIQLLPSSTSSNPIPNVPIIGQNTSNTGNTIQALGNLALAAFVLGLGLISIRSTQWGRAARRVKTPEEALLHAWERTELQFQSGMIEESVYKRLRDEYKNKLVALRLSK
jgi:hypothetical protein